MFAACARRAGRTQPMTLPTRFPVPALDTLPGDIWDITAIAAFFALSNRMANVIDMKPNVEFDMMGRLPK